MPDSDHRYEAEKQSKRKRTMVWLTYEVMGGLYNMLIFEQYYLIEELRHVSKQSQNEIVRDESWGKKHLKKEVAIYWLLLTRWTTITIFLKGAICPRWKNWDPERVSNFSNGTQTEFKLKFVWIHSLCSAQSKDGESHFPLRQRWDT